MLTVVHPNATLTSYKYNNIRIQSISAPGYTANSLRFIVVVQDAVCPESPSRRCNVLEGSIRVDHGEVGNIEHLDYGE